MLFGRQLKNITLDEIIQHFLLIDCLLCNYSDHIILTKYSELNLDNMCGVGYYFFS
jgi:hypothetical protein